MESKVTEKKTKRPSKKTVAVSKGAAIQEEKFKKATEVFEKEQELLNEEFPAPQTTFPNNVDVTELETKSKNDLILELERIKLTLKQSEAAVRVLTAENNELKEKLSKFTPEFTDTVTSKTMELLKIRERNKKWAFWHPFKYKKIINYFKELDRLSCHYENDYYAVFVKNYDVNPYRLMDLKEFYNKYIKK